MQTGFTRREAFGAMAAGGLAGGPLAAALAAQPEAASISDALRLGFDEATGEYVLPALPYDPAALEPHIDAQTMTIHHGKHHAAYVKGLNTALAELAKIRAGEGDPRLVKHWSREVSFHGSGHINHTLFWLGMAPPSQGGGGEATGELAAAITRDFGSFAGFAGHFKAAANQVEGGGWAWLVYEPVADRLALIQGEKQQDLMVTGAVPLLGLDVWEHAYYLKYQNRRNEYVDAFFSVINWGHAGRVFELARR